MPGVYISPAGGLVGGLPCVLDITCCFGGLNGGVGDFR